MKHRFIAIPVALTLALALVGCAPQTTVTQTKEASQMTNMILDPEFIKGAQIYAPGKPMTFTGNLDFGKDSDGRPPWLLTQWNSRNSIRTVKGVREGNSLVYENEFKTVARDDDGTITLRVNATKEYTRTRTKLTDPWVHLYMEQRYTQPYPIGSAERMRLQFSFSIPFFRDGTPEGELDNSLHASIAVFYIILKDMNPESACYGQFINFCVMLYDNRTPTTKEEWHLDAGQNPIDATNMMVYTMDSTVYCDSVIADGKWHDVDFDPLPYFRKSFDIAQRNNMMSTTKFEDLAVSSVFFGFEVPGVMDNEMKLRAPFLGAE